MITVETANAVRVLRFARPEKRNALTPEMLRHLAAAIAAAGRETDRIGAILLCGKGETFCAGFDLSLCRNDDTALEAMLSGLASCVRALRRSPLPVVVAARGAAIAGGCALLAGADVVVTDAAAKIGYPVVRLGISPAVSVPTLRLAVGDGAARQRALDPSLVDGREALRIGLAHECVASGDEVEPRALSLAAELAAKPRGGMAATKVWLNEVDGSLDDAAMEAALGASLSLVGSAEQAERLAALWAKS